MNVIKPLPQAGWLCDPDPHGGRGRIVLAVRGGVSVRFALHLNHALQCARDVQSFERLFEYPPPNSVPESFLDRVEPDQQTHATLSYPLGGFRRLLPRQKFRGFRRPGLKRCMAFCDTVAWLRKRMWRHAFLNASASIGFPVQSRSAAGPVSSDSEAPDAPWLSSFLCRPLTRRTAFSRASSTVFMAAVMSPPPLFLPGMT